jgi:hypothetical protein
MIAESRQRRLNLFVRLISTVADATRETELAKLPPKRRNAARLIGAQGFYRIDRRGAARRDVAGY